MVHGCATSVFIIDGGVLVKDVAVADSANTIVGVGSAEESSEETTDMAGGIVVADMGHMGRTCKPLSDGLAPFHNSILSSIFQ